MIFNEPFVVVYLLIKNETGFDWQKRDLGRKVLGAVGFAIMREERGSCE